MNRRRSGAKAGAAIVGGVSGARLGPKPPLGVVNSAPLAKPRTKSLSVGSYGGLGSSPRPAQTPPGGSAAADSAALAMAQADTLSLERKLKAAEAKLEAAEKRIADAEGRAAAEKAKAAAAAQKRGATDAAVSELEAQAKANAKALADAAAREQKLNDAAAASAAGATAAAAKAAADGEALGSAAATAAAARLKHAVQCLEVLSTPAAALTADEALAKLRALDKAPAPEGPAEALASSANRVRGELEAARAEVAAAKQKASEAAPAPISPRLSALAAPPDHEAKLAKLQAKVTAVQTEAMRDREASQREADDAERSRLVNDTLRQQLEASVVEARQKADRADVARAQAEAQVDGLNALVASLQEKLKKAAAGKGAREMIETFEEVMREEMASMKTGFEGKLRVAKDQMAAQQKKHADAFRERERMKGSSSAKILAAMGRGA